LGDYILTELSSFAGLRILGAGFWGFLRENELKNLVFFDISFLEILNFGGF